MPIDNIVLLGFMGTGKSTAGRELAELLEWTFIEMDQIIEEMAGCTIPEIFLREGETYFRDFETLVCRNLTQLHHAVVAAGGGVVTRPENVEILQSFAHIVLLTATPETIFERIIEDGKEKRPLLAKPDPIGEIQTLFSCTGSLYYAATEHWVDTTGKSPVDVAFEILASLRQECDFTY